MSTLCSTRFSIFFFRTEYDGNFRIENVGQIVSSPGTTVAFPKNPERIYELNDIVMILVNYGKPRSDRLIFEYSDRSVVPDPKISVRNSAGSLCVCPRVYGRGAHGRQSWYGSAPPPFFLNSIMYVRRSRCCNSIELLSCAVPIASICDRPVSILRGISSRPNEMFCGIMSGK